MVDVFKLTAKNIQCMRAILSLAQCSGAILESAWHHLLSTLQVSVLLGIVNCSHDSLLLYQLYNLTSSVTDEQSTLK